MASLGLVAPRFSTLGIIEGLRYLEEERNAEAVRQLNLAKVESEVARQRQLNIEADILQQTGLSVAQSEIAKNQSAAYQYTQAGEKYKADATATPILSAAQAAERNAQASKYYSQGTAYITEANAKAKEAGSQVLVDKAQASKYYSQGTAYITEANAKAKEADSQAILDKAKADEAVMKGNASLIKAASNPTSRRMPASSTSTSTSTPKPLTPSAEATALRVACMKSGDVNSLDCKKYNLRLAPKRTKTKKVIDEPETASVWSRATDPTKTKFGTGVTSSDVVTTSRNMTIPDGTTVIDKSPAYYQFGAD